MRRRAAAFALAAGASEDMTRAVELAVSETVTNAVVHAYVGREPGRVSLRCQGDGERMFVEVVDEGVGVAARRDSPGVGHGLALVGALARTLEVAPRAGGPGTVVKMAFADAAPTPGLPGLEPLCALALESLADASCLDIVSEGVLRRITAEVAGDAELTAWLRKGLPPSKPGTATWAALREGGARLVVHDPSVARSPAAAASGSGWRGGFPSPSGAPTARPWRSGASAAGRVGIRFHLKKCCVRSPTPAAPISLRRATAPCSARASRAGSVASNGGPAAHAGAQ